MKNNRKILIFSLVLSLVSAYCKGSVNVSQGGKTGTAIAQTSQYIDADMGGTISLGRNLSLSIPAGALDKSTEISVAQVNTPAAADGVNPLVAYEFGQHGLQFHKPALLKLCYSADAVRQQGLNEDSIAIYHDDNSNYAGYGGTVDTANHCVTSEINHFSTYFAAAQSLLSVNAAPNITGASFLPSTSIIALPMKIRTVVTDFNAAGRGQVANVWLHYCAGNTTTCNTPAQFSKVAMLPDTTSTVTTNRYTYSIPANKVTSSGITYFFEAIDNLRASRISATQFRAISATAVGLTIAPATFDIAAGFSRQLTVQVLPSAGSPVDIDFASISVGNGIGNAALNNQGVLVFDATTSGDPLATGYRTGTITASIGSLTASATANVWPGKLTAIQILDSAGVVLGSNIALAPSATFDFDARGLDAFGNTSLVYPAWIVTNPLVGSIPNNDGVFNASSSDGQSGGVLAIVDNIAGSITVNIVAPPQVTLGLSSSVFSENGGSTTVTAYLSQAYASPVTVNLAFSGTALPADFIASNNSITINPGQLSGDITLTGVDNSLFEGDKTVIVDISTVVNGIESGIQQVTATIQDDETAPYVIAATPVDGSTGNSINSVITLTFSQPMNPATMTTSTIGDCTGAIQVSKASDNFSVCVAMTTALAAMDGTNTVATLTPAAPLANNTLYKIRLTNAAQGASGAPVANPGTSPNGWTTETAAVSNQLNGSEDLDWFGSCVAMDGDYAVIGARNGSSSLGGYTIAKRVSGGWIQLQMITGFVYGNRNVECAISGIYIALKTSASSVAVFKNNGSDTFIQTATLTGFDTSVSGFPTGALALFGDTLVIGSPNSSSMATNFGAAFVFKLNPATESWDLTQRIDPTAQVSPAGGFGSAIATNGQVIAVTGREAGYVDILEKDMAGVWQNTGYFFAGAHDAETLALSSAGTLVVGAIRNSIITNSTAGVAFVVEKDGFGNWVQTSKLESNDPMTGDSFGFSVGIYNDTIAIGAQSESGGDGDFYNDPLLGRGAIYTFQRGVTNTWSQINKYDQPIGVTNDPDGRKGDVLGFSVAISSAGILGGAINTNNGLIPNSAQRGTVWAYPAP